MDEQGTQMVFYELSIECDSMNRKFEGNTHYEIIYVLSQKESEYVEVF